MSEFVVLPKDFALDSVELLAGARSLKKTMMQPNFLERARQVYLAIRDANIAGVIPDLEGDAPKSHPPNNVVSSEK